MEDTDVNTFQQGPLPLAQGTKDCWLLPNPRVFAHTASLALPVFTCQALLSFLVWALAEV